jgi:hypothetical protein
MLRVKRRSERDQKIELKKRRREKTKWKEIGKMIL